MIKKTADDHWKAMEADVARGDYVDRKAGREKTASVGDRWLKARRVDPRTAILYEQAWRLQVQPAFGHLPVGRIRPGDIQEWLSNLGEQYEESTLATAFLVLNGLLELAVADGLRKTNPAKSPIIDRPSSARRGEKIRAWPDARIDTITDAHPAHLYLVPVLMAGCGLRISEALAVCENDFDFGGHVLHVRRQIKKLGPDHIFALPKNDCERDVPLPNWVEAVARQHFRPYPAKAISLPWEKTSGKLVTVLIVIRRDDGSFIRYRDYMQQVWKPALVIARVIPEPHKNAKGKLVYGTTGREGPHQYRHFFASLILGGGGSVNDLAEWMGHHDPAFTLRIYGHMQQELRRPRTLDR